MELTKTKFKQTELGLIPEDWGITTLKEIAHYRRGSFPQPYGLSKWYDDVLGAPFVQVYDVDNNNKLKSTTKQYISAEAQALSVFVPEGTVVLTLQGSIGRIAITQYNAYVDRTLLIFESYKIQIDKYYFMVVVKELFHREKQNAPGGTIKTITKEALSSFSVPLPPTITEQKAIATALSDVDELIAKLEKLIEKKKAIKQGAMQTLLTPPHKGGKRLDGFSGEWVEVELSNILTFGSGLDYKHLDKGEIPVYGTGGVMTYVNDFLFDGESVGIGRKGTIDRPILLKGKFWTVDTLFYTHSFQNCIPQFIYYLFLLIQWKEYNEASGVPSLNKNTLGKIKVTIPKIIEEQEAIAQFLSTIENSINKLISRKSKLQSIKQGMMQELLTGRTRLV